MPSARWVGGLIHVHSKHSDGRHSISGLKGMAKQRKYEYMIVTDHAEMMYGKEFNAYVDDCLECSQPGEFVVIPGLEIATGWALPRRQDKSTAHTLALDARPVLDLLVKAKRGHPLSNWEMEGYGRKTTQLVHAMLKDRGIIPAPAHQFQYSKLRSSLAQPLKGSDFRYNMQAIPQAPGTDFYYRTIMQLHHEPADLGLYTGLLRNWLEYGGPKGDLPMPWAYAGSDFHAARVLIGNEQLSHATWIYVRGALTEDKILAAIAHGRTCATRGPENRMRLRAISPLPGDRIHKAKTPRIQVQIEFAKKTHHPLFAALYRDGVEVSGFTETFRKGRRKLIVQFQDRTARPGLHAYVVVISGKLVTSPILIRKE